MGLLLHIHLIILKGIGIGEDIDTDGFIMELFPDITEQRQQQFMNITSIMTVISMTSFSNMVALH